MVNHRPEVLPIGLPVWQEKGRNAEYFLPCREAHLFSIFSMTDMNSAPYPPVLKREGGYLRQDEPSVQRSS